MGSPTDDQPLERRHGERRGEERDRIRLFEQLVAAEQDERHRLALLLHDGAVQSLSGIALMLDAVGHAIEEDRRDEAQRILATALEHQRKTIQSLRDLSFSLEPVVLRDQGFGAAVPALAERLGLDRAVQVDVDIAAGEALSERAQVALYQLIREGLDQAVRRRPDRIAVTVRDTEDGGAELTIADDGHPERRRDSLEAFEERARPLDGRVRIDQTEVGTTVTVALPGHIARN